MVFKVGYPGEGLKDFIRSFYFMKLDNAQEINSGIIADDGCYELMFVLEEDNTIHTSDDTIYQLPGCYTLHYLSPPFKFDFEKTFTTFCIKLQPHTNSLFIPDHHPHGVLNLYDIYGKSVYELRSQIFAKKSLEDMIACATKFLSSILPTPDRGFKLIHSVCDQIVLNKGSISVQELAEQNHISRQQLNKIFSNYTKHTIKYFSNLIRMRAIIEFKIANPEISFTQAAYHFGYADQAHFNNHFKQLCGVSPSDFVATPSYSCNQFR